MTAILNSKLWVNGDDIAAHVRGFMPAMNNKAEAVEYYLQGLEVTPKFDDTNQPIIPWTQEGDVYGLPVDVALEAFSHLDIKDERTLGTPVTYESTIDCNHSSVEDPEAQRLFFDETLRSLREFATVIAEAGTGTGKTVCALDAMANLATTTLIIVKSKPLANQWKRELMEHLDIDYEEIGIVEGPICSFKGKKVVVAVIHNLYLKTFEQEFYDYFGFVIWDEGHALGAREFSKSMSMFAARYKLVLSATPYRKDGCGDLIFNYFGQPRVNAVLGALPATAYVQKFHARAPQWLGDAQDGALMKWLSKLPARNDLLSRIIQKAYNSDRTFVVMSHSIEHLEHLMATFVEANPQAKGGAALFTGSYTGAKGKRKQHGQAYLTAVVNNPDYRYLFATYSMMKEGIDIPRLDCGVEAIPRADNVQAIGRIRRSLQRKMHPLWFTIADTGLVKLRRYTQARLRGFEESGVDIIETSYFSLA